MSCPRRRSRLSLAPLLVVLASAACATAGGARKQDLVWPYPPEKPRIRHLRAFGSAGEMNPSGWSSFVRALMPSNARAVLTTPTCIALTPDEKALYVTNPPEGTLVRVDLQANEMKLVGDSGPGRLVQPFGVGVDADSNVYVSDQLSDAAVVFDRNGTFLRRFGAGFLERPTGLAVDRRAQLVYVVSGSAAFAGDHRIEVFSLAGEHLRRIGGRGGGPGEFNFPSYLAVDAGGSLYVSDMLNFRVQVFDREGRLQTMFGSLGRGYGQFDKSKGISFDTFGNVYVADALQAIQIFNRSAQPLMAFGAGVVQMPSGIVVDSRNHVFVTDPPAATLHEFVLFNTTAEDSELRPEKTDGAPPPGPSSAPGAPAHPRDG